MVGTKIFYFGAATMGLLFLEICRRCP